jgi:hypothetical protein
VFSDLCQIVDDVVALYKAEGKPLPKPASGVIEKLEAALG